MIYTSTASAACSPAVSLYPQSSTTTMSSRDLQATYDLRAKYTRFRILVIGRANAGKTTLLQRVCNTTEDPCIYDENNKNLVSLHKLEGRILFLKIFISLIYLRGTPLTTDIYVSLTIPMQRGIHESTGRSHSGATLDSYSAILLVLRRATRSNCRKFCHFWRRKLSRLM